MTSSRSSPAPTPYAHQAGGHREQLSEEGGALVVPAPGLVAKPTGHGYWAGEDSFYEAIAATDPELCRWCPAYHGTRTYAGRRHVILEDLTHGMREPCVMDMKMGTQRGVSKGPSLERRSSPAQPCPPGRSRRSVALHTPEEPQSGWASV